MAVAAVECYPVSYPEPNDAGATRSLLLVRLVLHGGHEGWGEAVTMWPEATRGAVLLTQALAELVLGRDVRDRQAVFDDLKRHTWWYGEGGLATFAIAALDMALWDALGRATETSLLDLLGGPVHPFLPVLVSCHATRADLDGMAAEMAGWVERLGAEGIKVGFGKRGDAALGTDQGRDVAFVAALREALGPGRRLAVDIGAAVQWALPVALQRAAAFAEYQVDWLEEPLGPDDPNGYRQLRQQRPLRLGAGEREWTPAGIRRLVTGGDIDVLGVDPGRCEGITGFREAAAAVSDAGRVINAHAWSSAVTTAASLALSLSCPAARHLEVKPLANPMQDELVENPPAPVGGFFHPPSAPGLGVTPDLAVLRRFRLA